MPTITAHSMISALGSDAAVACAAARAGLVRAAPVHGLTFTSDVSGEPEPLIAHAVPLLTRGFWGRARLRRLLVAGLRELRARVPASLTIDTPVALYLSWPDPERITRGLELIPGDEARAVARERTAELAGDAQDPEVSAAVATLAGDAAAEAGWEGQLTLRHLTYKGHAGGCECLALACSDLLNGRVGQAVVGGVDSLLDPETVAWLHHAGRLKLSGMPVGLMPGEAAAFVLLASNSPVIEAEVTAAGHASEPKTLWSGSTSVGQGLAQALTQVAAAAGWAEDQPAWVLADLNGEVYRANEWGHAVARLRADWPALENTALWLPAASFGDTGAASALVAVCSVLQAQLRGYAPAERAVIVAASEGENRSAVVMQAAGTEARSHVA